MKLIDFFAGRYQFEEDDSGRLNIRRKTRSTLGIFGRGKSTTSEDFQPIRTRIAELLQDARRECGPCTRAEVVDAAHAAAEVQFRSEAAARKNR